jgi:hypothetical protein
MKVVGVAAGLTAGRPLPGADLVVAGLDDLSLRELRLLVGPF